MATCTQSWYMRVCTRDTGPRIPRHVNRNRPKIIEVKKKLCECECARAMESVVAGRHKSCILCGIQIIFLTTLFYISYFDRRRVSIFPSERIALHGSTQVNEFKTEKGKFDALHTCLSLCRRFRSLRRRHCRPRKLYGHQAKFRKIDFINLRHIFVAVNSYGNCRFIKYEYE